MNVKTKLRFIIGTLLTMIVILLTITVINLITLAFTEPNAAAKGLEHALWWVFTVGGICIVIGTFMLVRIPVSVHKPIHELINGIQSIANHNYGVRLEIKGGKEFSIVTENFNKMAARLQGYSDSSLAKLRSEKNFREVLINSIHEPIIGLGPYMDILFINDEALNVLNLKREVVLNQQATEIALNNDLLRRLVRELIHEPDKDRKKEPLKIYADSKESYFQVKYLKMEHQEEEKKVKDGFVILLKNITEFKELDSAKTTFISTISHELKTPISTILMSQQLLDDQRVGNLNPEQEELSRNIKESAERLLNITGELLNMTQAESGKLQLKPKITKPIELIEYAIKANHVQAEKFNIQIEVDYPDQKIDKLFVDSEKIAWVLTNLLSNAIRYSPENGHVIIGAYKKDKQVILYVKDFGKGIDPRYHESIFEHYFRVPGTKVQGSGLGLSISKDFVEAHGGTIHIDSALGNGSTFSITFPI